VEGCWFEAVFHEGLALSGAKTVAVRNTVFLDCGQGLEVGYSGPLTLAENCLAVGNLTGMRFGDNYNWNYTGFLTVTNSILLNNYRDVFGHTWNTTGNGSDTNQWVERVLQMAVQGNYLTVSNQYHPQNQVWNSALDGSRLAAFTTSPAGVRPGAGFALWSIQVAPTSFPEGIPVSLSSFAAHRIAVDVLVEAPGNSHSSERLVFEPGEIRKFAALTAVRQHPALPIRVSLSNPEGCEITGMARAFVLDTGALGANLAWGRWGDELVLFWVGTNSVLQYSDRLEHVWSALPIQESPYRSNVSAGQHFYRLLRP
jgi:hypothetical protein